MARLFSIVAIPLLLLGGGCASITEGTDQNILVNLNPKEAECTVTRKGQHLGAVDDDNRVINVSKSRNDLIFDCRADGYEETRTVIESTASSMGIVGCFLIDLCITDYSTGALNKYPESVTINLLKAQESESTANLEDKQKANVPVPQPGTFGVALATFRDPEVASKSWENYVHTYPGLGVAKMHITPSKGAGGETLYSLSGTGLSEQTAEDICAEMDKKGDYCHTVQF
jgi:hypothetical protein